MPNWKKLVVSGSDASLNSLTTPWGISFKADATQQQFYIRVDGAAGAADWAWGTLNRGYHRITDSVFSTPLYATNHWVNPIADQWYPIWLDTSLNMSQIGDTEYGFLRAAPSSGIYGTGRYQEISFTLVVGGGYNNNYFRIQKIK